MIDRAHDMLRAVPMVDHPARVSNVGRLIIAASTLVAVVVALVLIQRSMSGPFLFGLLFILAAIGVIALFGGATGLFGLVGRNQSQSMTRAFVDAAPEGVLVTDRDGRIIYANRAYADLIGAASERDVRADRAPLLRRRQCGARRSIALPRACARAAGRGGGAPAATLPAPARPRRGPAARCAGTASGRGRCPRRPARRR